MPLDVWPAHIASTSCFKSFKDLSTTDKLKYESIDKLIKGFSGQDRIFTYADDGLFLFRLG